MFSTAVLIKWVSPQPSCLERALAVTAAWATMPSPGSSPAMLKSSVSHTMGSMSLWRCFGAQHSWACCWTSKQESWSSVSLPQGRCFTSTARLSLARCSQSLLWLTSSSPSFTSGHSEARSMPPITLAGQAMLPSSGLFPGDVCGLPHGQFLKRWDLLQTQT